LETLLRSDFNFFISLWKLNSLMAEFTDSEY
jgi:hypothetical protein